MEKGQSDVLKNVMMFGTDIRETVLHWIRG